MPSFTAGWQLETAVAEALGLDVSTITRVELALIPGECPTVTVEQALEAGVEQKLVSVFRLSEWKAENSVNLDGVVGDARTMLEARQAA